MSEQVIGSCSICGGDVVGHSGGWWAITPPPSPRCLSCGATASRGPVIPMVSPSGGRRFSTHESGSSDNTKPLLD